MEKNNLQKSKTFSSTNFHRNGLFNTRKMNDIDCGGPKDRAVDLWAEWGAIVRTLAHQAETVGCTVKDIYVILGGPVRNVEAPSRVIIVTPYVPVKRPYTGYQFLLGLLKRPTLSWSWLYRISRSGYLEACGIS